MTTKTDRVVGVIVVGGTSLDPAVGAVDPALTPFAGRYRFVDFALATLANSGITTTYILSPPPARALAAHVAATAGLRPTRLRPRFLSLPAGGAAGRLARVDHALPLCRDIARKHGAASLVVLSADHVLRLDLGRALDDAGRPDFDACLLGLPVPGAEASVRTTLRVDEVGRVRDLREPTPAPPHDIYALAWAGDMVLRAAALADGARPLQRLVADRHVVVHDVVEQRAGDGGHPPYWHDPTSLEDYYDAHMALCSARSPLDLHDPAWPMPVVATGLAPARVVADEVGRPGQTLNAIVSEGAVIRGGLVANAVVSPAVVVESGAEVEDCVLLDGCRIGRNARVRRAVVGAGAVIEDGAVIGYGAPGNVPARPSGLTVVPGAAEHLAVAANAR